MVGAHTYPDKLTAFDQDILHQFRDWSIILVCIILLTPVCSIGPPYKTSQRSKCQETTGDFLEKLVPRRFDPSYPKRIGMERQMGISQIFRYVLGLMLIEVIEVGPPPLKKRPTSALQL